MIFAPRNGNSHAFQQICDSKQMSVAACSLYSIAANLTLILGEAAGCPTLEMASISQYILRTGRGVS